ncbi:LysR family transcriptional regulator [Streptomyces colonosanans]|uniref:LysR family transcriptional regulator n=1 Tax=Streptomyces colonosanans TaxID=1428652 RepID=UPI000A4E6660|nr:LysR family transcriptional regulator [Streptomyces colonosanans]
MTSQIRALQSSLGTELFDRLGSRIRLTEAGERLLPYARQIIELSEEARGGRRRRGAVRRPWRHGREPGSRCCPLRRPYCQLSMVFPHFTSGIGLLPEHAV